MDNTRVVCFQPGASKHTMDERQNLDSEQKKKLDEILRLFSNTRNFKHEDVLNFNKMSGLYVDFKYGNNFYSIPFSFDGRDVFFEARFRMFNSEKYDSDDEDEKGKMTSYHFVPFDRLYPIKLDDGTFKLTVDMYFEFVYKCLTMDPYEHEYRK
jgi:hypothetical protein